MSLKAKERMVQSGLSIGVMPIAIVDPPPEDTIVKNLERGLTT